MTDGRTTDKDRSAVRFGDHHPQVWNRTLVQFECANQAVMCVTIDATARIMLTENNYPLYAYMIKQFSYKLWFRMY